MEKTATLLLFLIFSIQKQRKMSDTVTGDKIISTVKYSDGLMLLAMEETVLQGVIDKLIEIGRCYGMKMNIKKTKMMRI